MTDEPGTDLELLEAWRGGNSTAGNRLFERYFATVHRYFANKVASERDAEDLIQRTFLACVEGQSRFTGAASFRSYLLGIAHHLLCQHYRGQRRDGGAIDFSEASVRDLGAGPSTLLGRQQDQAVLLEALRSIPLDAQVVLELTYWERMTGPELGEYLAVPENTARSRLRKAKQLLLEALRTVRLAGRSITGEDELDAWAAEVRAIAFADG